MPLDIEILFVPHDFIHECRQKSTEYKNCKIYKIQSPKKELLGFLQEKTTLTLGSDSSRAADPLPGKVVGQWWTGGGRGCQVEPSRLLLAASTVNSTTEIWKICCTCWWYQALQSLLEN